MATKVLTRISNIRWNCTSKGAAIRIGASARNLRGMAGAGNSAPDYLAWGCDTNHGACVPAAGKLCRGLHKAGVLSENRGSMKLPDRASLNARVQNVAPFLLAAVLLAVGCVSLDKPSVVQECSKTNTCVNGGATPGEDANVEKKDSDQSQRDTRPGDEPSSNKPDAATDSAGEPDTAAGPDSSTKKDSAGAEPTGQGGDDVAPDVKADGGKADLGAESPVEAGRDASSDGNPGDDVGAEAGPEAGPEAGAEAGPEAGPEAGAEAGREAGAEAGREAGPEAGPEAAADLPPDTPPLNCSIFFGSSPSTGSAGHPGSLGTAATCVATCDTIAGWSCSNDDGRTVTVNGTAVKCGAPITQKNGYFVFQVGAGTNRDFAVFWWADSGKYATSCTAPAGGF